MFSIITAFLLTATFVLATDFDKCASGPAPTELRLVGCSTQPCTFTPGKDINAEVDFPVDHTITALTPHVKATVLGLNIDYPVPSDGCGSLKDASCPLQDGETDTWIFKMTIPAINIESPVDLEITLTDQDDKLVSCFDLHGNVVITSK